MQEGKKIEQHPIMDSHKVEQYHERVSESRRIKGAGCQVIFGISMVGQTRGNIIPLFVTESPWC